MEPIIRKENIIIDELRIENGKHLAVPLLKCAAIAIIENPFIGEEEQDLSTYGVLGKQLGRLLMENALRALRISPEDVQSYGKAVVTGLNGEMEHGAALLHQGFDDSIREILPLSKSIVPSAEKVAPAGCTIDVPLHHYKAMKIRSHYDGMEVFVQDAPRANEIMIVLSLTTGGRPLSRVGGLEYKDAIGQDGVN